MHVINLASIEMHPCKPSFHLENSPEFFIVFIMAFFYLDLRLGHLHREQIAKYCLELKHTHYQFPSLHPSIFLPLKNILIHFFYLRFSLGGLFHTLIFLYMDVTFNLCVLFFKSKYTLCFFYQDFMLILSWIPSAFILLGPQ